MAMILTVDGRNGCSKNRCGGKYHSISVTYKAFADTKRVCVIYKVVNMLVYFEPAALCDLHEWNLILAPLPAKKQLWEANDKMSWQAATQGESELQKAFGLATNGDLVKADLGGQNIHNVKAHQMFTQTVEGQKSTSNWEEWCSGMDGLGSLVMLAASLLT